MARMSEFLAASRVARVVALLSVAVLGVSITVGASGAPSAPSFTAISAGGGHTCVLTNGGGVKCWGSNRFGQLGNGVSRKCNRYGKCAQPFSASPVDVVGLAGKVKAIAAGGSHTCALTRGGGVMCWGYNARGQLGSGQRTCTDVSTCAKNSSSTPVAVVGLTSGVKAISAGDFHTCALTSSGGVKCWGSNASGQLGNNSGKDSSTPVAVAGLTSGVSAIAAGAQRSCAITSGGGVTCWGTSLLSIPGLANGVTAIAVGASRDATLDNGNVHACALTSRGGVKCWGVNYDGQLGNGSKTSSSTPVDVVGLASGVKAIAAGAYYTCAVTSAGKAECWGSNTFATLGSGSTADSSTPVDVVGLASGVKAIAAGAYHACALMSGGGVKCWGWNTLGRLGNGSAVRRSTKPVDVLFSPRPSAKPSTPSPGGSTTGGRCSKATALQVATPLQFVDTALPNPIAGVLCGAFTGPGSQAMVVTFAQGTCWPNSGWAVFRFTGGAWRLVPNGYHGGFVAALSAVGLDIRETVPVRRKSDGPCNPSGGTKSRIWHWNGTRFTASSWKQVTKGAPEPKSTNETLDRRAFYSPSGNLSCDLVDRANRGNRYAGVTCTSRKPPRLVSMGLDGRLTICRGIGCIGNPGVVDVQPIPTLLAYGRQITVGRFRCLSLEVGVRCTVIRSGKGFLINRDGVSRVGP